MLHSLSSAPERILTYGPGGSSKTTGWMKIAQLSTKTKSDAIFYVGDTDNAVPRMLDGYPELASTVKVFPLYEFPDYQAFGQLVAQQARPQDWIIIDIISAAWRAVQSHFVTEIFKQNIGDYFLNARKELSSGAKNLSALEGWVDWPVINALYRQWVNPLLFKVRANVYATAEAESLSDSRAPTEDQATRALLLPFGAKPVGQKQLPHQFHTLLLTGRDARGAWVINTVKDRERQEQKGKIVTNFALDYLVGVAGWKL